MVAGNAADSSGNRYLSGLYLWLTGSAGLDTSSEFFYEQVLGVSLASALYENSDYPGFVKLDACPIHAASQWTYLFNHQ